MQLLTLSAVDFAKALYIFLYISNGTVLSQPLSILLQRYSPILFPLI